MYLLISEKEEELPIDGIIHVYIYVAAAVVKVRSMPCDVILSDGPTLWVLYVASCNGLQKVQEHWPSLFAV